MKHFDRSTKLHEIIGKTFFYSFRNNRKIKQQNSVTERKILINRARAQKNTELRKVHHDTETEKLNFQKRNNNARIV